MADIKLQCLTLTLTLGVLDFTLNYVFKTKWLKVYMVKYFLWSVTDENGKGSCFHYFGEVLHSQNAFLQPFSRTLLYRIKNARKTLNVLVTFLPYFFSSFPMFCPSGYSVFIYWSILPSSLLLNF